MVHHPLRHHGGAVGRGHPPADAAAAVADNIEPRTTISEPKKSSQEVQEVDEDGYWMTPPLSELKKKSLSELRNIPNFKIGRNHYGLIEFLEPVDLSSLINLDDICGKIVIFASKSCVVYPDDNRPKPGEGLNLPARITLEGCYPISKKDKLPILDPANEVVKRHIDNLKNIPELEFVSYDPKSGNWTFLASTMD